MFVGSKFCAKRGWFRKTEGGNHVHYWRSCRVNNQGGNHPQFESESVFCIYMIFPAEDFHLVQGFPSQPCLIARGIIFFVGFRLGYFGFDGFLVLTRGPISPCQLSFMEWCSQSSIQVFFNGWWISEKCPYCMWVTHSSSPSILHNKLLVYVVISGV